MKTIYSFLIALLTIFQLHAQKNSELFGFAETPGFIQSSEDGKFMFASDNINLIAWDIAASKIVFNEEIRTKFSSITYNGQECRRIGGFGWPSFNSNQNELMLAATYYEYGKERTKIGTVFFAYNLETKSINQTVLPGEDELFTFSTHPTNADLVAAIFMDNNTFVQYAALVDLKSAKIKQKLLIGKGALSPLCVSFSKNGQLVFTGFGNSSYGGGFEIHDATTGSLVKRVTLPNDQARLFFEWKDFLIVSGHTNTYLISRNNWTISYTFKNMEITDINTENGTAVGAYIKLNDRAKFDEMMITDLETKKVTTHKVTQSHSYRFLPQSDKIYAPFFKHSYKPEEKTTDKPSVIIFDIPK